MDAEIQDGETELEWANRTYHPCQTGIHVCGQGVSGGRDVPTTVQNFPILDHCSARRVFEKAKVALFAPSDPDDLCIDLMIGDDLADGFHICRQLLPRLVEIVNENR